MDDNELLKKDNAELQTLLAESREDVNELREELEEQRVRAPSRTSSQWILSLLELLDADGIQCTLTHLRTTGSITILGVCLRMQTG